VIEQASVAKKEIGPRVDLKIMADWGVANFHAIAGWLSAGLRWQSGFWWTTVPSSSKTSNVMSC